MPKGIFKKNLSDLTKDESSVQTVMDNVTGNTLNIAHNDEEQTTPELNCFGYVFFREPNGNWATVKVSFDADLSTAEFSEKEFAGSDKQMALESYRIVLGNKVF